MYFIIIQILLIFSFLSPLDCSNCLQKFEDNESDWKIHAKTENLRIISMNTTSNLFLSNVLKIILQEKLGFQNVTLSIKNFDDIDQEVGSQDINVLQWTPMYLSAPVFDPPLVSAGFLGTIKKFQFFVSKNVFSKDWMSKQLISYDTIQDLILNGLNAFKRTKPSSIFSKTIIDNSRFNIFNNNIHLPYKIVDSSPQSSNISDVLLNETTPANQTHSSHDLTNEAVNNTKDNIVNFVEIKDLVYKTDHENTKDVHTTNTKQEFKCANNFLRFNKLCNESVKCGVLVVVKQDERILHSLVNLITSMKLHLNIYCLDSPSMVQDLVNEDHAILLADWSFGSFIPRDILEEFVNIGDVGDDEVYAVLQDHQAYKTVHRDIQLKHREVYDVVEKFHFTMHQLKLALLHHDHHESRKVACDWLKKNKEKWQPWLHQSAHGPPLDLVAIMCGKPSSIIPYNCSALLIVASNFFTILFFLLFTITCLLLTRTCYRRKLERLYRDFGFQSNKSSSSNNNSGDRSTNISNNNSNTDCHHFLKLYHSQDNHSLTTSITNSLDQWEIPRSDVVMNRKLGEGAFGTVFGGEALIAGRWVAVAVKTLKLHFKPEEKLNFLSEAEIMKRFEHENIVKLLGVCMKGEPVLTVMEFMLHGDLKTFLLSRRQLVGQVTAESDDVSAKQLTRMSLDVAYGLKYLSSLNFVHRDIACRNCLVHSNKTVKIGDFGMTRLMNDSDHYKFNKRGMFPVRWMAPESLLDGIFSAASDVWSFGVLIYEILTFGAFPYQGFSNSQVLNFVKGGGSLTLPSNCPFKLEALLKRCWSYEVGERIKVDELIESFVMMPSLIVPCLESPNALVTEDEFLTPHLNDHCSSDVNFNNHQKTSSKNRNINSILGLNLIPRLRHRNQYQKNLLFVNRSSTPVNALCHNTKKVACEQSAFLSGGSSFQSDESDMKLLKGEEAGLHDDFYKGDGGCKQSRTIETGLNLMNRRNKNSVLSLPSFYSKYNLDKLRSKIFLESCESEEMFNNDKTNTKSNIPVEKNSKVVLVKEDGCKNSVKISDRAFMPLECIDKTGLEDTADNGSFIGTLKKSMQRKSKGEHKEGTEEASSNGDETFGSRGTVIHCDMTESMITSKEQLASYQPVSLSSHLHRSISQDDLAFTGKHSSNYYSAKRHLLKCIFNANKNRYIKRKEKKMKNRKMSDELKVERVGEGSESRESTLEAPKRKNKYRHTVVIPFGLDDGFATEPRINHKKTPRQEPHMQLLDQYFYGSKTDSDYCSQHSKEFSSQFSSFLS